MKDRIVILVSAAALVTLLAMTASCSGGSNASDGLDVPPVDLSGSWILNGEESEDPRSQMTGRGGGGRGGRGGGGGGGQQRMQSLLDASVAFKIVQDDSTLTLTSVEGTSLVFYPDGRTVERVIEGAGKVETKTRWKGEKLVVERRIGDATTVTSTYELASEGRQLRIKVKIDNDRMQRSMEFLRVYDAIMDSG